MMTMKGVNMIVLLCAMIVATMMKMTTGQGRQGTIFIFGDSILDVGTNNHLNDSKARADHLYYGIDYPDSKSTGRFSNGYNSADLLAAYMTGYTVSPPPFLTLVASPTFQKDIFNGANFASGGSGILSDTGHEKYGRVIPLWEQIQQFATIHGNISVLLGNETAAEHFLATSTYIISIGSNDFFEKQKALSQNQTTPEQLIANLTTTFAIHLQNLYDIGARKFAIIGVPPLGCCPVERYINITTGGNGGCVEAMNELAQAFHASTEFLLQNLSSTNQGFVYSLGNTYNTIISFIDNSRASGFQEVETACCGNGTFNAKTGCKLGSNLCINRDLYLFWDEFHPTEAAARKAALTLAYANGPEFVTPMNFSSLAKA